MKPSPLIIAGMMTFVSIGAHAEGGAERMRHYYDQLRLSQQENPRQPTVAVQTPDDQTAQVTEHYKP